MNSLRLEKGYKGWGAELTNEITMIEADMERFVAYDKGDFVGRDALLKKRDAGVDMKLVLLAVDSDDADPLGNEPVSADGKPVGITTSGGYGHAVGQTLAFAYVAPDHAAPDSTLEVAMLGRTRAARVLARPPYDPRNARLKA
jgi:dimethylglycine dehydrogenase